MYTLTKWSLSDYHKMIEWVKQIRQQEWINKNENTNFG